MFARWGLLGIISLCIFLALAPLWAADRPACAGSTPICRFRLLVEPAAEPQAPLAATSTKGSSPAPGKEGSKPAPSPSAVNASSKEGSKLALPINAINVLQPGEKLKYLPLHLPEAFKDKAKVAVLLAPAAGEKSQHIVVLDAQPAEEPAEWTVPVRASVVGVVFGPRGLSVKKVSSLVNKDDELVPELADYAQQTETVQALIQTLSQYEQAPSSGKDLNAALQGFSAQYNVDVPKLDPSAPTSQQASTLLRAVLPSLSSYDPLAAGGAATVQQTTGLAASVASLFFGSPVGLAAGGTAFLTNLHSIMSPDMDFRAAFTVPAGAEALALCAKPAPRKAHSRPAYLWMLRVPDEPPPSVSLPETANLALGSDARVEVAGAGAAPLKLLPRARDWRLVSPAHDAVIPVNVDVGAEKDTMHLDLRQAKLPPGEYHLAAKWDWTPFEVAGTVRLHHPGDFSKVKLTAASADRLLAGSGPVTLQLTGTDFEFVQSVSLLPAGKPDATPKTVTFALPAADSADAARPALEAQVDTTSLPAGSYLLRFTQSGNGTHDVPILVHPPNPTLSSLPWRVNLGEAEQTIKLHGSSLERITAITSDEAQWHLASVAPGSHDVNERPATIKLSPQAKKGERLEARLSIEGIQEPVPVPGVLVVAGPRPRITGADASFPQATDVELRVGEIPSGSPVSFAIHTEDVDAQPTVALGCADSNETRQVVTLRPGDKTQGVELDQVGEGMLFLSLDPGTIGQSGCALTAQASTPDAGDSLPYTLGHVIRLPRIKNFSLTDQKAGEALYFGSLTGEDLQIIAKTGWNAQKGFPVQGIPTPVPGDAEMQTLKIELAWPPPTPRAPLYVWLRGETTGRKTEARY